MDMDSISKTVRVKRTLQHEMCAHPVRISVSNLFETANGEAVIK